MTNGRLTRLGRISPANQQRRLSSPIPGRAVLGLSQTA